MESEVFKGIQRAKKILKQEQQQEKADVDPNLGGSALAGSRELEEIKDFITRKADKSDLQRIV